MKFRIFGPSREQIENDIEAKCFKRELELHKQINALLDEHLKLQKEYKECLLKNIELMKQIVGD